MYASHVSHLMHWRPKSNWINRCILKSCLHKYSGGHCGFISYDSLARGCLFFLSACFVANRDTLSSKRVEPQASKAYTVSHEDEEYFEFWTLLLEWYIFICSAKCYTPVFNDEMELSILVRIRRFILFPSTIEIDGVMLRISQFYRRDKKTILISFYQNHGHQISICPWVIRFAKGEHTPFAKYLTFISTEGLKRRDGTPLLQSRVSTTVAWFQMEEGCTYLLQNSSSPNQKKVQALVEMHLFLAYHPMINIWTHHQKRRNVYLFYRTPFHKSSNFCRTQRYAFFKINIFANMEVLFCNV